MTAPNGSFGGSHLDRYLFDFEAVPDAVPVDAGDVVADAEPADTVSDAPVDTPADDTPSWTGPSQEDWEQTQYALTRLASVIDQPQVAPDAQPQGPGEPPEYDPFDPESVKAYTAWEREQTLAAIQEIVAPAVERAQQEQQAAQNELLKDAAHDVEQRKGEFVGDEKAIAFARQQMLEAAHHLIPQFIQRYGETDRAADLALEAAHEQVKAYQDSIVAAGVERYKNELATLSGAPNDPASGATGLHSTPQVSGDEMDFARHYAARA